MKKTKFDERNPTIVQEILDFEPTVQNELAVICENNLTQTISSQSNTILDKFLLAIKWIFLYLPGVASIHLAMMGLGLMLSYGFYGDYGTILGLLGFVAFGTFLIMLGFSKMKDLKYLKSVFTILGFSFLLAVFWDVLAIFIKGDFWGFYTRFTFPLIALIGYLSKRMIDNEENN